MFDFSWFGETTQVNNLWFIILMLVFIITSLGGLIASISTLVVFLKHKFDDLRDFVRLVHDNRSELDDVINHLDGIKVHYFDHVRVEFEKRKKK